MTDLGVALRERLADIAEITPPHIAEQQDSQDGTRKWAIAVEGGSLVEAVLIPEGDRATFACRLRWAAVSTAPSVLPVNRASSAISVQRNYWSGLVGDQFLSRRGSLAKGVS